MTKADEYQRHADNCRELADRATALPEKARYARMEKAWRDLAETQQWLDGAHVINSSNMRT
jgi:hypothetical protein